MRKMTVKAIKNYVVDGVAVDITAYTFTQTKDFLKKHTIEKIAYSSGQYGINAGLIQDVASGQLYAITARNSNLFMIF
jgi:hypothetical protein